MSFFLVTVFLKQLCSFFLQAFLYTILMLLCCFTWKNFAKSLNEASFYQCLFHQPGNQLILITICFFYSVHTVKKNILESHFVEYETSYIIESINLAQKFNIDCEIAVDPRAVQRLGALTTPPLAVENPCIIFDPSELNLK